MVDSSNEIRLRRLLEFLQRTKNNFYDGIAGVYFSESGRPGPTVGITVATHGNEIAGIEAVERLIQSNLNAELTCGRVLFVINNLLAAEKFLTMALMGMHLDDGAFAARYVDVNGTNGIGVTSRH